jgi:hypothetical protein
MSYIRDIELRSVCADTLRAIEDAILSSVSWAGGFWCAAQSDSVNRNMLETVLIPPRWKPERMDPLSSVELCQIGQA